MKPIARSLHDVLVVNRVQNRRNHTVLVDLGTCEQDFDFLDEKLGARN